LSKKAIPDSWDRLFCCLLTLQISIDNKNQIC
jgi:hypothetical protein